jgi:hypothetical protein
VFIRLQWRNTSLTKRDPKMRLGAILVESARIGGKPRQRHVAYLGNIEETKLGDVRSRCRFWESVVTKLDKLNQVTPIDRERIEQAIRQRVRCPTREQYDEYDDFYRARLELLGSDWVPPALTHWPP